MTKLKITTMGSSLGIALPKDVLSALNAKKGDTLYTIKTPRGVELVAYDPQYLNEIKMIEDIMDDNNNLLRKLADS